MYDMVTPANPCLQKEAKALLEFFYRERGKRVVLGQHTQTAAQEELEYIESVTGKLPALCGFELLGYSPNACIGECTSECTDEYREAAGTLKQAWKWVERGGILTFTWHWFSPCGGHDKSFFTRNTDFDARRAAEEGTEENRWLAADMDYMAGLLRPFCDEHIPILWRPFHECEGDWFWWGAGGADAFKKLYSLMFERFVCRYRLNNLIWVYNSPKPEYYPGDSMVDIITRDLYPPERTYISCEKEIDELKASTSADKLFAVGEIGTVPDICAAVEKGVPLSYFMVWSKLYGTGDRFTDKAMLKRIYSSDCAVTLDRICNGL